MTAATPVTPAPAPPATAAAAAPAAADGQEEETPGAWGRVLDGVGIIAGVVLVGILIDIFTDGRFISRRFFGRGDDTAAETEPAPPDPGPAQ